MTSWAAIVRQAELALEARRREREQFGYNITECVCGAIGGSRHVHFWRELGLESPYGLAAATPRERTT